MVSPRKIDSSVPLSAFFEVGSPVLWELEQANNRHNAAALIASVKPCRRIDGIAAKWLMPDISGFKSSRRAFQMQSFIRLG